MNLNFFQYFTPKDTKFFPLFEKASANLIETSKALVEMTKAESIEKRRELIKKIEELEHIGDNITHETFHELSANFITPFDREDIHHLVSSVDDVIDYIHGASKRMELYQMINITPPFTRLAELILEASVELHSAISALKNKKSYEVIRASLVKINFIENQADDVYDDAIAKLFENEKNAIELIKMKEILHALETATDKCEDAANVIESIIVKNA